MGNRMTDKNDDLADGFYSFATCGPSESSAIAPISTGSSVATISRNRHKLAASSPISEGCGSTLAKATRRALHRRRVDPTPHREGERPGNAAPVEGIPHITISLSRDSARLPGGPRMAHLDAKAIAAALGGFRCGVEFPRPMPIT